LHTFPAHFLAGGGVMSKNKTPRVPEGSGMGDQDDVDASSPATRLLDALGRGDLNALLLEFRPTTIIRTEDRTWSVQGEEDVLYWLEEAFERFPGLVFDSHARHVGYGQVIEEARVRDIGPLDPAPGAPAAEAGGTADQPRLNMPVRLTVLHDDGYVHEIIASYPQALLRSALGQHVDPLDMAVSEIQSAFVASAGSGFKTYQMGSGPQHETEYAQAAPVPLARAAEPEPEVEPEPEPEPVPIAVDPGWTPPPYVPVEEDEKPRRRALVAVPVVMALVAAIAAGSWWLGRDDNAARADSKPGKGGQSAGQNKGNAKPSKKPSSSSPTPSATPTKNPPVVIKSNKPTVATLESDLAFDKGSAVLSEAAKAGIAEIADAVREAGLKGTIAVHGYTDNVGSAKSGIELSKLRAQAVAQSLRGALGSYAITIAAFWHGEDDPIASNDTEAGRQKNRRVTIILPKPPES
jgi:outer membrane protein OmpA-like peptidoglycan-associated protein